MTQKAEQRRGFNLYPDLGKPSFEFQQCQVKLLGNPSLDLWDRAERLIVGRTIPGIRGMSVKLDFAALEHAAQV